MKILKDIELVRLGKASMTTFRGYQESVFTRFEKCKDVGVYLGDVGKLEHIVGVLDVRRADDHRAMLVAKFTPFHTSPRYALFSDCFHVRVQLYLSWHMMCVQMEPRIAEFKGVQLESTNGTGHMPALFDFT